MPERTLERRLALSGLPRAVSLLASSMTLHSTWRLEIEGQRVKEAAMAGGFVSRDAFAAFLRRHAGCALTHLAKPGSFLRVLERFQGELTSTASFRRESRGLRPLARSDRRASPKKSDALLRAPLSRGGK